MMIILSKEGRINCKYYLFSQEDGMLYFPILFTRNFSPDCFSSHTLKKSIKSYKGCNKAF